MGISVTGRIVAILGAVAAVFFVVGCAGPGQSSGGRQRASTEYASTPSVPSPSTSGGSFWTGSVLATESNAFVDRSPAITIGSVPTPEFIVAWATEGARIVVSTFGSSACTLGHGRPVVIGVTDLLDSQSVVIALERPLTASTSITCLADYGRSDFFVALPVGAVRCEPLNVEIDGQIVHLDAADASTGVPTS